MKIITEFRRKSDFTQQDCSGKNHHNIYRDHVPKAKMKENMYTHHSKRQMLKKLAFKCGKTPHVEKKFCVGCSPVYQISPWILANVGLITYNNCEN